MARICVAVRASGGADDSGAQWIEMDDAYAVRCAIAKGCPALEQEDAHTWSVLAYDGLPDFGPRPDLDELLAWLDAVDEYGPPFEALWASGSFDRVLRATEAFADSYQGTYADAASWAYHTFTLLGRRVDAQVDIEAYVRTSVTSGQVRFIPAVDGGIHVFWND